MLHFSVFNASSFLEIKVWYCSAVFVCLHSPHDVLATLLNNLKVQERQNRVCTTVAIAIVAETCSPFTVLPALMNEYRVPELNVQNGVLKSLSFMFEYIGEMGKDYIYPVAPLLEDALMDRLDSFHVFVCFILYDKSGVERVILYFVDTFCHVMQDCSDLLHNASICQIHLFMVKF